MTAIRSKPSSQTWRRSSATSSSASFSTKAIAATMRHPNTSSGCSHQARSGGVTPKIKRELRRRSAVEPVIGHLKSEHRMGRNYLWHRQGDATNAVLAAAGYNFRRLLRWLQLLLRQILVQLILRLQLVPS